MYLLQVFKHCNPDAHLPWAPDGPPQGWSSDLAHVKQHPHSSFAYRPLSQQWGGGGHWKFGIKWHKHASTDCWLDVKYRINAREINPRFARKEKRGEHLCRCEVLILWNVCFLGQAILELLILSFNDILLFLLVAVSSIICGAPTHLYLSFPSGEIHLLLLYC